jgi:hypothetical protein
MAWLKVSLVTSGVGADFDLAGFETRDLEGPDLEIPDLETADLETDDVKPRFEAMALLLRLAVAFAAVRFAIFSGIQASRFTMYAKKVRGRDLGVPPQDAES